MQDKYFVTQWNSHPFDSNSMHKTCVHAAEDRRLNPLPAAVELERRRAYEVTQRLLLAIPQIDKAKLSHRRAFEREVVLLHMNGAGVGVLCQLMDREHLRITGLDISC